MATTEWLLVAAFLVGGLILGLLLARVVSSVVGSPKQPEPLRDAAGALSSLTFSIVVIGGFIGALGVVQPTALDQLPQDLIAYVPKLLSAAIIVLGANVLASFATAALGAALARASTSVQRQVSSVVKYTIIGLATILAVGQLGVDTAVIQLGVAAIFFGVSACLTLLVGLGGREVAGEVASSRAVRRMFKNGDRVEIGGINGELVAVHPTAVELVQSGGGRVLIPTSKFVGSMVGVTRSKAEARDTQSSGV